MAAPSRAKWSSLPEGIKLQDRRIGIAATEAGGDARRHRVEAAMEDPNIAVTVDMHPDDLTPTAAIMADVAADEAMTRSAVRGGLDSRKREICSRLAEGRTLRDVCRDNHELPEPPHRRASLRRLQMTRDNLMYRNCRLFQQNRPMGDIRRASGRAWTINMSSRREPSLP